MYRDRPEKNNNKTKQNKKTKKKKTKNKQRRPRSDAANTASDQGGLHCLTASQTKTETYANSVGSDETARNEPFFVSILLCPQL